MIVIRYAIDLVIVIINSYLASNSKSLIDVADCDIPGCRPVKRSESRGRPRNLGEFQIRRTHERLTLKKQIHSTAARLKRHGVRAGRRMSLDGQTIRQGEIRIA